MVYNHVKTKKGAHDVKHSDKKGRCQQKNDV
jgi:hypothetical protein